MDVHFTPEQQAQIAQAATKAGTVPEHFVTNLVVRYLGEEARFSAAVENEFTARSLDPSASPLFCTGRDLAELLRAADLSEDEAKAWRGDLHFARKKLKAPSDRRK
jgi:hypothetical protein